MTDPKAAASRRRHRRDLGGEAMSDLVKRLRARRVCKDGVIRRPYKHEREAADRIEVLEKALRKIVLMPECMDPAHYMCEIAMIALGWDEEIARCDRTRE